MVPSEIVTYCAQYGPWGMIAALTTAVASLGAWIKKLHREIGESHKREVRMAEKVIPLVEMLRMFLTSRGGEV